MKRYSLRPRNRCSRSAGTAPRAGYRVRGTARAVPPSAATFAPATRLVPQSVTRRSTAGFARKASGKLARIVAQLPTANFQFPRNTAPRHSRALGVGDWKLEVLRVQPGGRVGLRHVDFVEDFLLGEHAL